MTWIKCSDKEPPYKGKLLFWGVAVGMFCGKYTGEYIGEYAAVDDDGWTHFVTHWQPLPEPPEEK